MTELKKPEPLATGTFAQTPFAHILIYILEKGLQGTLEIEDANDKLSIYFRSGSPAKVDTTRKSKRLGDVLLELGKLNTKQLRESVDEMKRTGELHGQVLVRMGMVDAATLVAGITEQMTSKMIDAFIMKDANFAFFQGVNLITGGSSELINLDAWALLMAGARMHGASMQMNQTVGALKGKSFYLPTGDFIDRYKFDHNERMLCRKLLESPQDLDLLRKWDALDNDIIKAVLYVLIITKSLTVVSASEVEEVRASMPPLQFVSSVPPPPEKKSYPPEIQELRTEIQSRATAISSQNYYQMLGVAKGASDGEIRTAFFRLAKRFHPDRSAKEGLQDLREILAYMFANFSEAQSTLTDIDSRETYDKSLGTGAEADPQEEVPGEIEEEEEVRKVLEAATLFQKALVILRQDRFEEAWEMIDKAFTACPDDGEYMAAHAYLQMKMGKRTPLDVLHTFREAEKANPKSERLHIFFAQALMRSEKVAEAKRQFQKVLEINPRNIEAAREIRVIDMRQRNTGKHKAPSFFSKFRK